MSTTKTPESTRGSIGQGLYSLGDLRTYLAFDGKPKDGDRALYWLTDVLNPVGHQPQHSDYSFTDLVSLFVVRELLKRGVKRRHIRAAEDHFRTVLGVDRPFACEEISTDGSKVFGPGGKTVPGLPAQAEEASHGGQHVLLEPIRDMLHTIRYVDGEAAEWTPVKGIVLNPDLQFGDPVVEGSRLRTADAAAVAEALGIDEAVDRFAVKPGQIKQALDFEHRLAALRN